MLALPRRLWMTSSFPDEIATDGRAHIDSLSAMRHPQQALRSATATGQPRLAATRQILPMRDPVNLADFTWRIAPSNARLRQYADLKGENRKLHHL